MSWIHSFANRFQHQQGPYLIKSICETKTTNQDSITHTHTDYRWFVYSYNIAASQIHNRKASNCLRLTHKNETCRKRKVWITSRTNESEREKMCRNENWQIAKLRKWRNPFYRRIGLICEYVILVIFYFIWNSQPVLSLAVSLSFFVVYRRLANCLFWLLLLLFNLQVIKWFSYKKLSTSRFVFSWLHTKQTTLTKLCCFALFFWGLFLGKEIMDMHRLLNLKKG